MTGLPNFPIFCPLQELYTQSYSSIHWPSQRNNIAQVDIFAPHTKTLNALMSLMGVYTKVVPNLVRNAGLDRAYTLLCKEDENTGYQCLGPVNKMLNYVVRWAVEGPNSHAMEQHREKLKDFLWMSGEGLQMCGTNGSQLWDAAFIAQAVSSSSRLVRNADIKPSVQAILRWLDETQIKENPQHYRSCYRFATKGAWPFSTKQQGYTVSDCTAEGLKAVIDLQSSKLGLQPLIDTPRLRQSVDLLLTMQNPSGGFASYETINGPAILEWINPAEVFGDIMIEYDYPECTTSVVGALCKFRSEVDPTYRRAEIDGTVERAVRYILRAQRADGSWFGSWAVCFTYATMFALESLSLAGQTYTSSAPVRKACEFLLARQSPADGGWGESFESCVQGKWVPLDGGRSNVVQTAWALIALLHARYPDEEPIRRAVKLLMQRQKDDGSWEDDGPSEASGASIKSGATPGSGKSKTKKDCLGVFNRNCGIVYPNYRFSFTIWALARAAQRLEGEK
jgi:lanosterol synthase